MAPLGCQRTNSRLVMKMFGCSTLRCHFCIRLFKTNMAPQPNNLNRVNHMQAKLKLSYITYILLTLCISSCLCVNTSISNTSALSYQTQTGIKFTFNPTINISISSDLTISNLTPGTTSDSNNITVDVATNTSYGYTVSALANSTNLTHSNNANTFSGIATNANLENLITDNTLG